MAGTISTNLWLKWIVLGAVIIGIFTSVTSAVPSSAAPVGTSTKAIVATSSTKTPAIFSTVTTMATKATETPGTTLASTTKTAVKHVETTSTTGNVATSTTGNVATSTTGNVATSTTGNVATSTTGKVATSPTGDVATSTAGNVATSTTGNVATSTTGNVATSTTGNVATSTTAQQPDGCLQPPDKENSRHNGTGGIHPHSTLVLYRCEYGYYETGFPYAICLNGTWRDYPQAPFSCQLKSCPSPGFIENADRNGFVFTVGASVQYVCHVGYQMRGRPVRICMASGKWSGEQPSCVRIMCDVPLISNGIVEKKTHGDTGYEDVTDDKLPHGTKLYVSCYRHYSLTIPPSTPGGPREITCIGGIWYGLPQCQPASCDLPDWVPNGRMNFPDDDTITDMVPHSTRATVECDAGFIINGNDTIVCVYSKWSDSTPSCVPDLRCKTPSPRRGVRSVYRDPEGKAVAMRPGQKAAKGTVLLSRCAQFGNMKLTGNTSRRCEQGLWTGVAPTCRKIGAYERKSSRRVYTILAGPPDAVTLSDQGHLMVRRGSTIRLLCLIANVPLHWTSSNGIHPTVKVEGASQKLGTIKQIIIGLDITNAEDHHSDTYFCSAEGASTPTAEFVVKVY